MATSEAASASEAGNRTRCTSTAPLRRCWACAAAERAEPVWICLVLFCSTVSFGVMHVLGGTSCTVVVVLTVN